MASTYVLKHVLEDEGFQVELKEVDAGPMFAAVASGDADGTTAAWLPATHKDYMAEYKDQVVDLGPNLEGTQVGSGGSGICEGRLHRGPEKSGRGF